MAGPRAASPDISFPSVPRSPVSRGQLWRQVSQLAGSVRQVRKLAATADCYTRLNTALAAARCQHAQLARQRETHVFLTHRPALDRRAVAVAQIGDALLDHLLGGAGPGSDQHGLVPGEPLRADLLAAVDQVGWL